MFASGQSFRQRGAEAAASAGAGMVEGQAFGVEHLPGAVADRDARRDPQEHEQHQAGGRQRVVVRRRDLRRW